MGSCCTNNSNSIGEQFIRDILRDEALTIRNYSYNELLNEIVSKRIEQEIPIENVKRFLIPEFFDSKKAPTNGIYIESIFNYILEHLEERNNMYTVLLYFYPFIKHDEENIEQNFFNIFRFITKSQRLEIERENVRILLFNYISFCSWGITSSIKNKLLTPDELESSFESLLNGPYSEDKLNNFLDRLMKELTGGVFEELITLEMFQKMFKKYDISVVENVREYLLTEE
jgi:hypothetical protein